MHWKQRPDKKEIISHNFKLFLKSRNEKDLDPQSIKQVATSIFMNRQVFFYFLRFIICSIGVENVDLGKTVQLGLVTDQTLPSHTEVFTQLIIWIGDFNKNASDSNWTRLELVPVSVSKNLSVNSTIDTLCNSLFPRNVLGILSLVNEDKTHLLTTLAGVFHTPILGISRSISLKNQDAYGNYVPILPSLDKDGTVLRKLVISLSASKFAVLHDNTSDSRIVARHLAEQHEDHITEAMMTVLDTMKTFDVLRVDVISQLTRVRLRDIRVIVLICRGFLVDLVFDVGRDLRIHGGDYLWIGSNNVMQFTEQGRRNGYNGYPVNFIAISMDSSLTKTGKRGLQIFAHAVGSLNRDGKLKNSSFAAPSCYNNATHTSSIRKALQRHIAATMKTKPKFSSEFVPYTVLLLERPLNSSVVWTKIGWQVNNESMELNTSYTEKYRKITSPKIKKLRISTITHGNYQYKLPGVQGPQCLFGVPCVEYINRNDTYVKEVFCVAGLMVDIINLLSDYLGFAYELHFVKDGRYGGFDEKTGKWNGFIAELLNGEADMALATLTINAQRSRVIDFTYPYAEVGIGILTAANYKEARLFNRDFFNPLSEQLWLLTLATVVVVLMLLWILDKKSHEWFFKGRPSWYRKVEKQRATLLESMSYSWSTFVRTYAGEGLPRSFSARLVAAFFAFAMLIIHTSYTANLAAHKVKEDLETPVTGIYDEKMLNPPPGFRFATMKDTSAESFFRDSQDPRLKKIYNNMKPHLVDVVEDGVEKVKNGYFAAYVEDKPYLEYLVSIQMNCSLRLVGKPFGVSGYGIALPKNSPLTSQISQAILDLQDKSILSQLWSKWAVRKCIHRDEFRILPESMALSNVSGLFMVVACAVVLSGILVGVENVAWHIRKRSRDSTILHQDATVIKEEGIEVTCLRERKSTKGKKHKNGSFESCYEDLNFRNRLQMNRTSVYFSDDMGLNNRAFLNGGEIIHKRVLTRLSLRHDYQNSKM